MCPLPNPMLDYYSLLINVFERDKSRARPCDRFTDGFSIGRVMFVCLDVGLHELWRHQLDGVPERLELTCPIVGAGAGLHAD